jgi:hypothetical protein
MDDSLMVEGDEYPEMTPLKISTEQMIALHGFFAEASAAAEPVLAQISGCETETEVLEIRATALCDFGERGMRLSEDLVAGVIGRLEGALPGSLNIVLEPEDALLWAQMASDERPLETFVALGSEFLAGIAVGLSEILETECQFRDGKLVEDSELAMFVKTHAPSDTVVFSLRLRINVRDEVVSAVSHLMIEPKYLAQIFSALSAAVH